MDSLNEIVSAKAAPQKAGSSLFTTIFHEPWWLDAASPGGWEEVSVADDGVVIARLPYVAKRFLGMTAISMPSLTRTLGPQLRLVATPTGPRLPEDRPLMAELMGRLPRHSYFNQTCDPLMDNGLALHVLGYEARLAYTFRIPAGTPETQVWSGMRQANRRMIRKAEKLYRIDRELPIDEFCHFYNRSNETNHQAHHSPAFRRHEDLVKTRVYEAATARQATCILAARDEQNQLQAAIMPVWGHGIMYYLLTVRSPELANTGAVNLLAWEAIKIACAKGLIFDFDGFLAPSAVNFLSGFGGITCNRLRIMKSTPLTRFARSLTAGLKGA